MELAKETTVSFEGVNGGIKWIGLYESDRDKCSSLKRLKFIVIATERDFKKIKDKKSKVAMGRISPDNFSKNNSLSGDIYLVYNGHDGEAHHLCNHNGALIIQNECN